MQSGFTSESSAPLLKQCYKSLTRMILNENSVYNRIVTYANRIELPSYSIRRKLTTHAPLQVSVPLPPVDSTSVRIILGWRGRDLAMLMSNLSVSDGEDIIASMAD